jgi:hypothetical protein
MKRKERENQRKKKNDIAMLEEIEESKKENNKEDTEQNKKQKTKQTSKERHLVHPIKEMNGKEPKHFKRKMR